MELLEQLKVHEGFRSKPYHCSEGKLTIGYGLNLEEGISMIEAEALLEMRVDALEEEVYRRVMPEKLDWFGLPRECRDVIMNMAYNLGVPRLFQFKKMWAAIAIGDYEAAADEMMDSKWAVQVGQRAFDLSEIMRRGAEYDTY